MRDEKYENKKKKFENTTRKKKKKLFIVHTGDLTSMLIEQSPKLINRVWRPQYSNPYNWPTKNNNNKKPT